MQKQRKLSKKQTMIASAKIGNDAHRASVNRTVEFARGAFKRVYRGRYTEGARAGQECVAKEFIDRDTYQEEFFRSELTVVEEAAAIVGKFNIEMGIPLRFYICMPEIWEYAAESRFAGVKSMVEPLLPSFTKFNSNTGWVQGDPRYALAQALSHFSYHATGGRFVLCDLQGSWGSTSVTLTDPVVMSRSKEFGPSDLGAPGIESFFARHVCTASCKPHWNKPNRPQATIPLQQGTSMISLRSQQASLGQQLQFDSFKAPAPRAPPARPQNPPTFQNTVDRRSADDCAICLCKPQIYGILSDCTHAFCFSCIAKWRGERSTSCPTCRVSSRAVIPSVTFVSGAQKITLLNLMNL